MFWKTWQILIKNAKAYNLAEKRNFLSDIPGCPKANFEALKGTQSHSSNVNPYQPSVDFYIEMLSKSNDWFLYEMQHWVEMG